MQFATVMRRINEFVEAKGWARADSDRPQTPRNLAISISIEASELLECFQWSDHANRADLENELADVLIYSLRFAQVLEIDPLAAVHKKLEQNHKREWPRS